MSPRPAVKCSQRRREKETGSGGPGRAEGELENESDVEVIADLSLAVPIKNAEDFDSTSAFYLALDPQFTRHCL